MASSDARDQAADDADAAGSEPPLPCSEPEVQRPMVAGAAGGAVAAEACERGMQWREALKVRGRANPHNFREVGLHGPGSVPAAQLAELTRELGWLPALEEQLARRGPLFVSVGLRTRLNRRSLEIHLPLLAVAVGLCHALGVSLGWAAFFALAEQNAVRLLCQELRQRIRAVQRRHRAELMLGLVEPSLATMEPLARLRMDDYFYRIGGPPLFRHPGELPDCVVEATRQSRCHFGTAYHGLRSLCFWDAGDVGAEVARGIAELEAQWPALLAEALRVVADDFRANAVYDEHVGVGDWRVRPVTGEWSYIHLYDSKAVTGIGLCRFDENCNLVPTIAAAAEAFPRSMCGLVGLSRLAPGSRIPPHRGPLEGRLTLHLPLFGSEGVTVRVGDESRPMADGKVMIFDDTHQHEVWHDGPEARVSLMMDIFHPDLTVAEGDILKAWMDVLHTRAYDWCHSL